MSLCSNILLFFYGENIPNPFYCELLSIITLLSYATEDVLVLICYLVCVCQLLSVFPSPLPFSFSGNLMDHLLDAPMQEDAGW